MKKAIAFTLFVLACGGATEEDYEELELGQTEEAMSAPTTPTYQFGTNTGSQRGRCDKTSGGQVCAVPSKKSFSVCIHQGNVFGPVLPTFTPAERNLIKNQFAVFDAVSGVSFTFDPDATSDCDTRTPLTDISLFIGSVGSSGTGSNNIKDYVTNSWQTLTGQTEGAGVVGQYQRWSGACNITVDRVDGYAKGTSSTQDGNMMDHMSGHGIAACLGLGSRSDGGVAPMTTQVVNASQLHRTISSGESCSLGAFASGTPASFNLGGTCALD